MTQPGHIPSPEDTFPNEYSTTVFLKNVVKAENVVIGDYTYYDSTNAPEQFEENNILFNYPFFGEKLIVGKFCQIAHGTKFLMGAANHRLDTATTYPFNVMGGIWRETSTPHIDELPHKGDTVVGNDVWLGRDCLIMPVVKIGDGAIVAAASVVTKDVAPYTVAGGNPARFLKRRFDEELTALLLAFRWWDLPPEEITTLLPVLCSPDLTLLKDTLRSRLARKEEQ